MSSLINTLKSRVGRLSQVHLNALGSFHAFEELEEYCSRNKYGDEVATRHAQDISMYIGFMRIAQQSLNTQLHIKLAQLFVPDKNALTLHKLISFARNDQQMILRSSSLKNVNKPYSGLSDEEWLELETELAGMADKIEILRKTRNQEVAHLNMSSRIDPAYNTFEELLALIVLSEKILNKISAKFYGESSIFDIYRDNVTRDSGALFRLISKVCQENEYKLKQK